MTIKGGSPPHPHDMAAANRTLSCDKTLPNTHELTQASLSVRIYFNIYDISIGDLEPDSSLDDTLWIFLQRETASLWQNSEKFGVQLWW